MNTGTILGLLVVGLVAGALSSFVGIGGGTVVVPALVFLFAMNQKMAQGTSLAMLLPPIGILGVYNYYKQGYVDLRVAGILCIAFVVGSYFGSKVVLEMDMSVIKKLFAVFLILIAIKYLFFDK
ncbi:MAG TPA: sulfite exporter TauE/SafE family protein [Flavipsychrobacter sp.]|nr:sulfite exporter TauE/SafE family protein [Flavipsychrobacter sp.]